MAERAERSRAPEDFQGSPAGWHYFSEAAALRRGPVSMRVGGRHIVTFRGRGGVAAMAARCCHLGADLGLGSVAGDRIRCGLHGWEFGKDGLCAKIPTSEQIPRFARQVTYPVAEVAGHVFVFNRARAEYAMPFFDGVAPERLVSARPYRVGVDSAWNLVSANAFDVQHFMCAHDRGLVGEPRVQEVGRHARRLTAEFDVRGHAWRDRLTRLISGDRLTMSITVWGGLLMFVEARFRRTTTYGLLSLLPIGPARTEAVNIVFVERGRGAARAVLDPINAHIRKSFIRRFLESDVRLLGGLRYSPATLLAADGVMLDYLTWLRGLTSPISPEDTMAAEEAACEECS